MLAEVEPHEDIVLLSPGGSYSHRHAAPAKNLVVGTIDGIFTLQRMGNDEWSVTRRALPGCHISAITALEDGTLFAATRGVGIARSDDAGKTWQWINQGLAHFDVWTARAVRLNGRELVYAGTMPAHLYVTADRGETWRELPALRQVASCAQWTFPPPPHLGHVKEIVAHEGRLLFVGIEIGALLVSDDEGQTFRELPVHADPREVDVHHIALHPDRPDRIIVASGIIGMTSSDDRGATWRHGPNPPGLDYPDPLVMHPDDPDLLFLAGAVGWPPHWYKRGRSCTKIVRSRDGGRTWERLLGGLPDGQRALFGAMTLEAWKSGFAVYVGDSDGQIFESRDGGDSWRIIAETAPIAKGDYHRALAKGRTLIANVDELKFTANVANRLAKV